MNCTLVLTGSHSIDVRNATENLAGRRGSASDLLDKVFLPMKFSEFVECRNDELKAKLLSSKIRFQAKRHASLKNLFEGKIDEELEELSLYGKELELLFNDYLLTGGVPKIIDEYVKNSKVSDNSYKIYVDAVLGDMMRWDKKEIFVRQLISRLTETLGSTVSWNALKNNTDIEGHATVADYVETLRSGFVLTVIYHLNLFRGSPDFTKNKKIYFLDPFFLHALSAWSAGQKPFQACLELLRNFESTSHLVEGICADHLIRCAFGFAEQKQFFDYSNSLFYWKSEKQREVDFLLKLREHVYAPIELKYKTDVSRDDKQSIFDFQKTGKSTKAGVIITKDSMSASEKVVAIPIWLFLLLV